MLADVAARKQTITLGGNFTKDGMAGPVNRGEVTISVSRMDRILQYEPRDLTISVEAGIPYAKLSSVLAEHRQMIPLDPPFAPEATIGGVLAANCSGARRRQYGTARDMVIGMTFATLEGKLVRTGGMVVKNVAGLDMAKVMIGSFGTLAAIATVNFKLYPMPAATRTFVRRFGTAADVAAARDAAIQSVLQPSAIDILKTGDGFELWIQAAGSEASLARFSAAHAGAEVLEGPEEEQAWLRICEFTPAFLSRHPEGAVVRISGRLSAIGPVLEKLPGPAIARAGNGIVYGYFEDAEQALKAERTVVEFAPQAWRASRARDLWPAPGDDFGMMEKIKNMFDPGQLLNRGRLYGRI